MTLAARTEPLREARSRAGKRVTLSRTINGYRGAQPYYVVAYEGRRARTRYPVTRARAEALFAVFCEDITDPQAVKDRLEQVGGGLDAASSP
jgi:hypothetical protein